MTNSNCVDNYSGSKSGDLVNDFIKENNFLLTLVDTIPAKMYFDHDVQEKITFEKHSTMDQRAADLKRIFSDHAELSTKNKHKRARLDPLFQKSVSQIHQQMNSTKQRKHKKKGLLLPSASLTRAANIEELQKRLQERIDEFQMKRKGAPGNDQKKKKLKNKEKKMKQQKVMLKAVKEAEMQSKIQAQKKDEKSAAKPKFNKEAKIIYSKLDFSENGIEEETKNEYRGKKSKDLLKKAEKKKQKIEDLKSTNPEKAYSVIEKERWNKAILKSSNVKVKDDPALLKKSIKREEKIKNKKAKVWKERADHTEGKMKRRQEKRTKNIQKKKKEKLDHKIKRAKKKGRVIPGL